MNDERQAEIEAVEIVARAICGESWSTASEWVIRKCRERARDALAAVDLVRDARGDDALRAALVETLRNDRSGLGTSADAERIAGLVLGVLAVRPPQGEDHNK